MPVVMTFSANAGYRSNWPWQHKRVLFWHGWTVLEQFIRRAWYKQSFLQYQACMSYLSSYSFFFFLKNLSHCEAGKEKHVLCLYCLFSSVSAIRSWTITFHECLFSLICCSDDFKGDSSSSPALQNSLGAWSCDETLMGHLQLTELGLNNI